MDDCDGVRNTVRPKLWGQSPRQFFVSAQEQPRGRRPAILAYCTQLWYDLVVWKSILVAPLPWFESRWTQVWRDPGAAQHTVFSRKASLSRTAAAAALALVPNKIVAFVVVVNVDGHRRRRRRRPRPLACGQLRERTGRFAQRSLG